mgnify:CR=1 FL=1
MGKKIRYIGLVAIFLIIVSSINCIKAEENEYGSAEAWVKLKNGDWQEAPIVNVSLDIYEPFYVKATINNKVKAWTAFELVGAGTTKTFEVIEGPSKYEQAITYDEQKDANWSETFTWKLRPTDNKFAGGQTPLKFYVQFQAKVENDRSVAGYDIVKKSMYLNLILPTINNQIWEGYEEDNTQTNTNNTSEDKTETNDTPGFEIILLILAVYFVLLYKKKRD